MGRKHIYIGCSITLALTRKLAKIRIEGENLIRLQGKDEVLLLLQSAVPINHTHIKELGRKQRQNNEQEV